MEFMTLDEIKAERRLLRDKLQAAVEPLLQDFERRTGATPDVTVSRLDVITFSDEIQRSAYRVNVDLSVRWEQAF